MMATCPNPNCRHRSKRKLRPIVISIIRDNGDETEPSRHKHITDMFAQHPSLAFHFEPPVFSPGVPSRDIRNRIKFLQYANQAGLISKAEWEAIQKAVGEQRGGSHYLPTSLNEKCIEKDDVTLKHETIDPFRYLATTTIIKHSETESDNPSFEDDHADQKRKKKWYPKTETKSLVPISPDRKGPEADILLPYSMELWRKGKALNRDRSVFACTLAHLIAMKRLVGKNADAENDLNNGNEKCGGNDFDFILEDNTRAFVGLEATYCRETGKRVDGNCEWTGWSCECANRIWDFIEASNHDVKANKIGQVDNSNSVRFTQVPPCHLRYYGWLGSLPNLTWLYKCHIPRTGLYNKGGEKCAIFPFPTKHDMSLDLRAERQFNQKSPDRVMPRDDEAQPGSNVRSEVRRDAKEPKFSIPGGTAIFGAFAYTISAPAYRSLIYQLQNDVGSMLWKGKKMRSYKVKAIDKILPRHVREQFGRNSVHVTNKVAFVRGPMLGSLLHQHWDKSFCESTEWHFSLSCCESSTSSLDNVGDGSNVWDQVWLPDSERRIVEHRKCSGKWIREDEQKCN
ncbi:hypothetical protein ACHAXS_010882 [Conticribra weissflogii]